MSNPFDSAWLHQHEIKRAPKLIAPSQGVAMESELHAEIIDELKRRRLYFVRSRTDKRTTTQLGVPDFIIAMPNGKTLWVECKRKGNKLSQEQNITRHILIASGHRHAVVYSFQEFLNAIDKQ